VEFQTNPRSNKNSRIPELDGIRGIAIIMVLIWHYISCQEKDLVQGSVLSMLHFPTKYFWSGVDLFFVLSGFLIGGIILDYHQSKNFLKTFWIKRACRILPVYFLLLALFFVLKHTLTLEDESWLFGKPMPWWTYFLFVQNIAMGLEGTFGANFLGITWSLAVEEQFYLLAPICILCFGKKAFVYSLIPLIVLTLILRVAFPGFHDYVNMPFRMDALLIGVGVAVMFRHEFIWSKLFENKKYFLLNFLLMSAASLVLVARGALGSFKFFWFGIFFGLFLVFALLYSGTGATFFLRNRLLCFFGAISYGLYMYHQAVSGLIHGVFGGEAVPNLKTMNSMLLTICSAVGSITLAWISLRFFERRFLEIGKLFKYRQPSKDSL